MFYRLYGLNELLGCMGNGLYGLYGFHGLYRLYGVMGLWVIWVKLGHGIMSYMGKMGSLDYGG